MLQTATEICSRCSNGTDGTRSAAELTGKIFKALREKTNADQEDASMVSDMAAAT